MKVKFLETWPQSFVTGKIHCAAVALDGERVVAESTGTGTTCEIARANAYADLAHQLASRSITEGVTS